MEGVDRLQALLAEIDAATAQLGETDDAEAAVAALTRLDELARELASEIERQRRAAADEGDD